MTKKRGRKSGASISVISRNGIKAIARAEAPENLTNEQAAEWKAIVNGMPAD